MHNRSCYSIYILLHTNAPKSSLPSPFSLLFSNIYKPHSPHFQLNFLTNPAPYNSHYLLL